jgi:DNA-binding SARP family transcriptional activator
VIKQIKSFEEYRDLTLKAVEDYNNKDYLAALEKFVCLAETNPSNPKVHEVLILVYLKLGRYADAENEYTVYQKLLAESMPEFKLPPRKTFEEIVSSAGNQLKLEKEHKKEMKKTKNFDAYHSTDTVSRLSLVYMSKGEYHKAEEILLGVKEKIIETCPDHLRHCLALAGVAGQPADEAQLVLAEVS